MKAAIVTDIDELKQILVLQKQNLIHRIDDAEMQSQGFVTMDHNLEVLEQMHALAPSVIIKDENKVVAYALVMLRACSEMMPGLVPMFTLFDQLQWNGKPFNDQQYYVMGQICVSKDYRGQGLVEMLYHKHRDIYADSMDFIVTEIATRNHRSLRVHERVGFKTVHIHKDELDEWAVVLWDWQS